MIDLEAIRKRHEERERTHYPSHCDGYLIGGSCCLAEDVVDDIDALIAEVERLRAESILLRFEETFRLLADMDK